MCDVAFRLANKFIERVRVGQLNPVLVVVDALNRQPSDDIQKVILCFLEGTASDEDINILSNWLKESPDNQQYFDQVNSTFQASVTLNRINMQKTDDAWTDLLKQIDVTGNRSITFRTWFFRIAATFLLAIAASYLIKPTLVQNIDVQRSNIVKNSPGRNTRIVLPDSSVVLLNTNSTLEYPAAFGDVSREVYLKGEGYFDVQKGSKPFVVRTENIVIKVMGTRFNVQDYKGETDVSTTLEEGAVELLVPRKQKRYSLIPGDQVILNTEKSNVSLRKVDPSNFTAWKEESLEFDDTPLLDIVSKLENRFRVPIIVDPRLGKSERLTMTIGNETLDEVLELIQLSSHIKVKREHDKITIYP